MRKFIRRIARAVRVNFERSGFIIAGGSPEDAERLIT